MVNLCAMNHERLNTLYELTGNYTKATLLDKLIYWWQISTYSLNDGKIWFTRSIDEISERSKIPKRSVERYLSEFAKLGYIEKVNRLLRVKHLYIRITDKTLIAIAGISEKNKSVMVKTPTQPEEMSTVDIQHKTTAQLAQSEQERIFFNQNGVIDNAKTAELLYKDKDCNLLNNNTVSEASIVNNLNSTPSNSLKTDISGMPANTENKVHRLPIEEQIGERIDPQLKNYIKGTLKNLQTQHGLQFSNPDQIFAEMVFSVLNPQDQLTGIENTHHRVNIIAKLMREKRWTTPKGFYNHWDIGNLFKKRKKLKEAQYEAEKQRDMQSRLSINDNGEFMIHVPRTLYPTKPVVDYAKQKEIRAQQQQLQELKQVIAGELRYLDEIKKYYGHDEHPVVDSIVTKLAKLYSEQANIERSIEAVLAA